MHTTKNRIAMTTLTVLPIPANNPTQIAKNAAMFTSQSKSTLCAITSPTIRRCEAGVAVWTEASVPCTDVASGVWESGSGLLRHMHRSLEPKVIELPSLDRYEGVDLIDTIAKRLQTFIRPVALRLDDVEQLGHLRFGDLLHDRLEQALQDHHRSLLTLRWILIGVRTAT